MIDDRDKNDFPSPDQVYIMVKELIMSNAEKKQKSLICRKLYADVISTIFSFIQFDHIMLQARRVSKLWYDVHFMPTSYPIVTIEQEMKVDNDTAIHWCRQYFSHRVYPISIVLTSIRIPYALILERDDELLDTMMTKSGGVYHVDKRDVLLPIVYACLSGTDKSVEILVKHGCDVNDVHNNFSQPPLAYVRNIHQLHLLIEVGADINYIVNGRSIFSALVKRHEFDIALELLTAPDLVIREEFLDSAIIYGNATIINAVLGRGINVNCIIDGFPAIFRCLMIGNTNPVEKLMTMVARGANINTQGLLHIAVLNNHIDAINYLVEHNINPNVVGVGGVTPLFVAKTVDAAAILVEHGANVNAVDQRGFTPLFNAIEYGINVVVYLVEHGADKTVVSFDGSTLYDMLIYVEDRIERDAIKMLLDM